jgi:AraC-like DNA-binding protein
VKIKCFILFIVLFNLNFGKSTDPEKNELLKKATYEMIFSPDKSYEVLEFIEKNFSLDSRENEMLEYLKIKSLFLQNNWTETLKKLALADEDSPVNILILKRNILYSLDIQSAEPISIDKKNDELIFSDEISQSLKQLNAHRFKDPVRRFSAILKKAKFCNRMVEREGLIHLSTFLAENNTDFDSEFFLRGLSNLYKYDPDFMILYARYLILHHKVADAIKISDSLPKDKIESSTNKSLKYNYYILMIKLYSKTGDFDRFKEFVAKKESISKEIVQERFSAKNKWLNIFEEKLLNDEESNLRTSRKILFFLIIAGLLLIIILTIRYFKFKTQILEYQDFLKKIKILKERASTQPKIIPEKTENLILQKLIDFEKTEDFISPDISLQSLSKKLETNMKYLSETINTHKQKNFNTYINELRINYIIKKLNEMPIYRSYKIKYLAEESGFATHSSFTAVFKSVTGISPHNYIQLLKQKE